MQSTYIGRLAYYKYTYIIYIYIESLREYAHNESIHMWMRGMANCRLHIFTFSNGMFRTRFKRALSSFDVNCLLFYLWSYFYGSAIEQSKHTHTKQQQRKQKKIILDAWNLQSRLSCSETKEIKYRHITREREKKTSNESRWNIVRTQFQTDQQTHLNILFNIDNKHRSGGTAEKKWIVLNINKEKVYSRLNEVVNGWLVVNLYQAKLTRSAVLAKQPALIQHRSTRTCNEFALANGSSTNQFLPTLNRY